MVRSELSRGAAGLAVRTGGERLLRNGAQDSVAARDHDPPGEQRWPRELLPARGRGRDAVALRVGAGTHAAVIPDRRSGFRVLVLSAPLILSARPIARAEWQFTPFIGYTFKATSTFIDLDLDENRVATDQTRLNFGGAVRLVGEWPIGLEAYYVHTPG